MVADTGQKLESVVYLPSTARGLVGKYIRNTVFLIASTIGGLILNSESKFLTSGPLDSYTELRDRYDRGDMSIKEFEDRSRALYERDWNMTKSDREAFSWLLWLGAIASGGIAVANGYGLIDNRYYRVKTLNIVNPERGNITTTTYGFPWNTQTSEQRIDKITHVEATQSSIARILGTGKVIINGVVYTSAGSKDVTHTIPYIKNPHAAKDKILELLPEKAGLELKLRDGITAQKS